MKRQYILLSFVIVFLSFIGLINAGLMNCEFKTSCSGGGEVPFFYANKNFHDSNGEVLSSNVRVTNSDSNYNQILCCKINSSKITQSLNVAIENVDGTHKCSGGGQDLLYFTNNTNARVAFYKYDNGNVNNLFDNSDYSKKLCLGVPDEFTNLDIKISKNINFKLLQDYNCLFMISDITNGVVSSCDASFNGADQYPYTVWGKLWENIASLKCNLDCTSKLDNRVYSACSQKIKECENVPSVCDGSLYGAWVKSIGYEVKCEAPWTISRKVAFTDVPIEIKADFGACPNIFKKSYRVLVNNELINMDIYVCSE